MYPNLYYFFKDVFNISLPFLKVINTFGFMVAISFLGCAWLLIQELKRKQAMGLLTYTETKITVGEPANLGELIGNFIVGFLFGYKLLGLFLTPAALGDPQGYLFSSQGNLIGGILLGALLAFLRWQSKNKDKLAKPEERVYKIWPSDRVGDLVIIAFIGGFAGAKLFDNLENWDRFIEDPIGNLFSRSGLTFYGGLIVAATAIYFYAKKHHFSYVHLCDAIAPGLMFAYGWGRTGCQIAGDGDWGILNSAYISNSDGKVLLAKPGDFNFELNRYQGIYADHISSTRTIQHAAVKSFWGLPDWLFAYTYPHNVNHEGIPLAHCNWDDFCNYLPLPVFPTPLYEIVVGLLLCFFLWRIRKKINVAGRLFAIYLFINGIERFFIEKIRVNTRYSIWGYHPTQAEIISTLLVIAGVVLYWYAPRLKENRIKNVQTATINKNSN